MAKHSGITKRFGARYGKRIRERLAKVESIAKSKHKCPYCSYLAAKKESAGIFFCSKCKAKFTGKAWSPMRVKVKKQQKVKEHKFDDELFAKKQKTQGEDEDYAKKADESIKSMEKGSQEEAPLEEEN